MNRAIGHSVMALSWLLVLGAGLLVTAGCGEAAEGRAPAAWQQLEPVRALLEGADPVAERVTIEAPSVTQDGSAVPLTVSVDSPMTDADHIAALHVFASRNPSPEVAEFRFTPRAGEARIATRIRLDQTQTVVTLARTNNGQWLVGAHEVRVTVSGCLTRDDAPNLENLMQTRVRAPEPLAPGEIGEVRTLVQHPMETGLRTVNGETIPKRILHTFKAEWDGEPVMTARLHRAVSANPYLVFPIAPRDSGVLRLQWEEDGSERAVETIEIVSR